MAPSSNVMRHVLLVLTVSTRLVVGWEKCPTELGGGICPDLNTCCSLEESDDNVTLSGCISNGMGSFKATCCADNRTGCPKGYRCAPNGTCQATSKRTPDPLLRVLPRYTLCYTNDTLKTVYGLAVGNGMVLPYYSSHGPLEHVAADTNIQMALVIIHGGGRNADDYFCPAMAAAHLQDAYKSVDNVLVLAPRFLTRADGMVQKNALLWGGTGHGKWRYGAAAMNHERNFTSFDATDVLFRRLLRFKQLEHVVVAGHSVGAQFVQRWSLLTSVWTHWTMSAVVANPSSWTYLTPKRRVGQNEVWKIAAGNDCPHYNDWTWGLQGGSSEISPYKDRVLEQLSVAQLIVRYGHRKVTYLAGSLDRCNVTGKGQWCQSHDLGMSCADLMQGTDRWDRHLRYMESLKLVGIVDNHTSQTVEGVGHDHALMFTSLVGRSVLFPPRRQRAGGRRPLPAVEADEYSSSWLPLTFAWLKVHSVWTLCLLLSLLCVVFNRRRRLFGRRPGFNALD